MAWSKGNVKWTVQFKSKQGYNCYLAIYKRGYTGSAITNLSTENANAPGVPAENPFYYEEDDSENLLDVVRIKTGYINMVETVQNGLTELFPATNTELLVEAYYNNTLKFRGFIQAQSFENEWSPVPREISLPVISILGLLDGYYFSSTEPLSMHTIKSLLVEILNNTDDLFYQVVLPAENDSGGTSGREFGKVISSYSLMPLMVTPYNSDYDYRAPQVYKPMSYLGFIEGLCKCAGFIVHDNDDELVFSKFTWSGEYFALTKNGDAYGLGNYGGAVTDLSLITENRGDNNTESTVLPLNKITVNYNWDEIDDVSLNFERTNKYIISTYSDTKYAVQCKPYTDEITSSTMITDTIASMSNGVLPIDGVACITTIDEGNTIERIAFRNQGTCTWRWYNYQGNAFTIKLKTGAGSGLFDLSETNLIIVYIKCGNKYYNSTVNEWQESTNIAPITLTRQSDGTLKGYVLRRIEYCNNPLEFIFETLSTETSAVWDVSILNDYGNPADAYAKSKIPGTSFINGTPSPEDAVVDMTFNYSYENVNAVNDIRHTTYNYIQFFTPNYTPLLTSQFRLVYDCTVPTISNLTFFERYQCRKYSFWIASWRWRIIAMRFDFRDDLYRLTLHRSTAIE